MLTRLVHGALLRIGPTNGLKARHYSAQRPGKSTSGQISDSGFIGVRSQFHWPRRPLPRAVLRAATRSERDATRRPHESGHAGGIAISPCWPCTYIANCHQARQGWAAPSAQPHYPASTHERSPLRPRPVLAGTQAHAESLVQCFEGELMRHGTALVTRPVLVRSPSSGSDSVRASRQRLPRDDLAK